MKDQLQQPAPPLTPGTQLDRVYQILCRQPGVPQWTRTVAAELGLASNVCSTYLTALCTRGLVQVHRLHRCEAVYWVGDCPAERMPAARARTVLHRAQIHHALQTQPGRPWQAGEVAQHLGLPAQVCSEALRQLHRQQRINACKLTPRRSAYWCGEWTQPPPITPAPRPINPQRSPTPRPRPGSQMHQIHLMLHDLPGIPMRAREVADDTGLDLKACSVYLGRLCRLGLVQSSPINRRDFEYWVGERQL